MYSNIIFIIVLLCLTVDIFFVTDICYMILI